MMSVVSRWLRGSVRTARVGLVASAFVGVLAMHGFGDHGTSHHEMPAAVMTSVESCSHHAETHGVTADRDERPEGPSGDDTVMAGLCLAVLVAALLGLAALRSFNHLTVIRRWPYRIVKDLRATALNERDPPCLFELSIQRC